MNIFTRRAVNGGLLVASASIISTWASICSTSSLKLFVSSSSFGPTGFYVVGAESRMGI